MCRKVDRYSRHEVEHEFHDDAKQQPHATLTENNSFKKMNCSGSKFNHWRVLLNQSSTSATLRLRVCWKIRISVMDSIAKIVAATSEPISASDIDVIPWVATQDKIKNVVQLMIREN